MTRDALCSVVLNPTRPHAEPPTLTPCPTISERQDGVELTDAVNQEPTDLSFGLVAVTKDQIFISHSQWKSSIFRLP